LCFLTFFGEPRDQHRYDHAHESPGSMAYPLVFLAALSVCAGWVGIPWLEHGISSFVYHGEPYHPHASWALMIISTVVAVSGILLAWLIYYRKAISAEKLAARFRPVYTLLYNKYYFDEIYQAIIINPIMAFARFMWSFDAKLIDGAVNGTAWATIRWSDIKLWFDTWIVDGAVNGSGWLVRQGGNILRFVQTGAVQFYAMFILAMMILLFMVKFDYIDVGLERWFMVLVLTVTLAGVIVRLFAKFRYKPGTGHNEEELR
jgi:NADH-quinone oxidoreductase subunit L